MDETTERHALDATAHRILELLQADGRMSTAEIGRRLGMAQSAIHERIRKLEDAGVIQGYAARIDPAALGLGLLAFVLVRTGGPAAARRAGQALSGLDAVQEVHHVAGEDCLLVKVRARSTDDLWDLFNGPVAAIEGIAGKRTTIVLRTDKESAELPLNRTR